MPTAHEARFALVQRLTAHTLGADVTASVALFNELHPLFAAYEQAVRDEAIRDVAAEQWQRMETLLSAYDAEDTHDVVMIDRLRHWAQRQRHLTERHTP